MTITLTQPQAQSQGASDHFATHELRTPQDFSHLDATFASHLRRYERESVFIHGKVSSVTVVPNHESVTGYGFVVVRVLSTGKPYTLIDWQRNEFYAHLSALKKRDEITWIVAPIDWNESSRYPFMRDHEGNPYSQFYRGSKIVDRDFYLNEFYELQKEAEKLRRRLQSHSRMLGGKPPTIPRGYFMAKAMEKALEAASHRFKHVTNDPELFFPEWR